MAESNNFVEEAAQLNEVGILSKNGEEVAQLNKPVNMLKDNETEDLENFFQRFKLVPEQAKKEYLEIYNKLCDNLRADVLQPLNDALVKGGYGELQGQDDFIEELSKDLPRRMVTMMEHFWECYDIEGSLMSLEMLKEKFKNYEGIKWNVAEKTPEERTLPQRLHFRQIQIRSLKKQIEHQNEQLEKIRKENQEMRDILRQVSESRILMKESMQLASLDYEKIKMPMVQLSSDLVISNCDIEVKSPVSDTEDETFD